MITKKFQESVDTIVDKTMLWAFPDKFEPNWLTYFRIATVPLIWYLLISGQTAWAFTLFLISATTDMLDGSMARKRDKITDLGKVLDPIADKMLIGTVLLYIGSDYLVVKIFIIFIIMEIVAVMLGTVLAYKIGRPLGANFFGKIKMILQSLSVGLFLVALIIKSSLVILISEYILAVALFFALLSGFEIFKKKIPILKHAFFQLLRRI